MANLQSFERTDYQQVKADLHRKILDRLDLEKLGKTSGDSARDEVLVVIRNAVNSEVVPLSFAERERLSREILDEIFGLGPLEPLLKDPTRLRHPGQPLRPGLRRARRQARTAPALSFKDNAHLMQIIERIVSRVGRRVDESSPDGRCPPGRRIARQRHHSAAGDRRPVPLHPPFRTRPRHRAADDREPDPHRVDAGTALGHGQGRG